MKFETILYEIENKILTITLNRPEKLNAFTGQMMDDLIKAFDQAGKDDAIRVIVVTGAGRGFCAGADLSAGQDTFNREIRNNKDEKPIKSDDLEWLRDGGGRTTLAIYECPKPIIAAIPPFPSGTAFCINCALLLTIFRQSSKLILLDAINAEYSPKE